MYVKLTCEQFQLVLITLKSALSGTKKILLYTSIIQKQDPIIISININAVLYKNREI